MLGWLTFLLLKSINNYQVEVLITLALVIGGYALANHLGVSGTLPMNDEASATSTYSGNCGTPS